MGTMPDHDPLVPPTDDVTGLLRSIRNGDRDAFDRLFSVVYRELRVAARQQLARARPGDTVQTTALVHEAYLKLVGAEARDWHDRQHFFGVASRAMRQILVDYARARSAQKRGGGAPAVRLDEGQLAGRSGPEELMLLDSALTDLAAHNERLARIVELRFFAGLSVEETAGVMNLSDRTVKREWRKARAFLLHALRHERDGEVPSDP
jgi:RNA polymerase sigma factor (TIGR02999 family)